MAAAVAQIGASLQHLSAAEWRDTLQALESADISAIEDRLPSGQRSFFKSLAVSFQAIAEQMQTRYLALAVLLQEVPAPAVVLQKLWNVNEAETRRTASYFVDRSLALWEDETDPESGIRLHDLQFDYIRAQFADRQALDLIHGAVRLSSNPISRDPSQFASQLIGRLLPHAGSPAIQQFTKRIAEGAPIPWLRPLDRCKLKGAKSGAFGLAVRTSRLILGIECGLGLGNRPRGMVLRAVLVVTPVVGNCRHYKVRRLTARQRGLGIRPVSFGLRDASTRS